MTDFAPYLKMAMDTADRLMKGNNPFFDTIVAARSSYPRSLMIFYLIIQSTRFAVDNPKPKKCNIVGLITRFVLSFVCYAYPASIVLDFALFRSTPNMLLNIDAIIMWAVLFLIVNFNFLGLPNYLGQYWVLFFSKYIFLADITRVGFLTVERADKLVPENDKRYALVIWTCLIFVSSPVVLKAIFYGKVNFWIHPEGKSFFEVNYNDLMQVGSMVCYYLYLLFSKACEAKKGGPVTDCVSANPLLFAQAVTTVVVLRLTIDLSMMIFPKCCGRNSSTKTTRSLNNKKTQ